MNSMLLVVRKTNNEIGAVRMHETKFKKFGNLFLNDFEGMGAGYKVQYFSVCGNLFITYAGAQSKCLHLLKIF